MLAAIQQEYGFESAWELPNAQKIASSFLHPIRDRWNSESEVDWSCHYFDGAELRSNNNNSNNNSAKYGNNQQYPSFTHILL